MQLTVELDPLPLGTMGLNKAPGPAARPLHLLGHVLHDVEHPDHVHVQNLWGGAPQHGS